MIDLGVSSRQSFGLRFDASNADTGDAAQIKAHSLTLSPHPSWKLPAPENITWRENPFDDNNWLTQYHMLRWLDPLRRQAEGGDTESGRLWVDYAASWWSSNKPHPGLNRFVWADMVDGIRALALVLGAPLVNLHATSDSSWLIDALEAHVEWLKSEENLGHGNHALHQHVGLFVASRFLCDSEAADLAVSRLMDLFEISYDEQGMNAEGAVGYHLLNYKWWKDAVGRLEAENVSVPSIFARLDLAPTALAHATTPTGHFASLGDTDGGSPKGVRSPETIWMTSGGSAGEPPTSTTAIYDAGYVFTRSGWGAEERDFCDETFLSARFGPANRIHGHPDGTSLTYTAAATDWLVDPGKFQYGRHPMRAYCQSRASHNAINIVGLKYDRTAHVRCTSFRSSQRTLDVEFVDLGFSGVKIERRLVYSRSGEYFVVIDSISSDRRVTAVQNWQSSPGVKVESSVHGATLISPNGALANLRYMGTTTDVSLHCGDESPLKGWVSSGWKQSEEAPSIELSKVGKNFRFITAFAAGYKGAEPIIRPVKTGTVSVVAFEVSTGRSQEMLTIRSDGSTIGPIGSNPIALSNTIGLALDTADSLDREYRGRAFTAIASAYDKTLAASVSERPGVAGEFLDELEEFAVNGVDLGARACLADLRAIASRNTSTLSTSRTGLVNWDNSPTFSPTRENLPTYLVGNEISSFPLDRECIFSVRVDSLILPVLFVPGEGSTLTVLFQGAVDRAKVELPLFQRARFQKTLNAGPHLVIADPTLDLSRDLRLGWYLGTERTDLLSRVSNFVRKVSRTLGLRSTVLSGSSGGGFAALHVGALIPNSHVIAFNPQTDLREYFRAPVEEAIRVAFGVSGVGDLAPFLERVSVIERMKHSALGVSVIIVQNEGDVVHKTKHSLPLLATQFSPDAARVDLVSVDWGPGHRSPTNEQYHAVMDRVYRELI